MNPNWLLIESVTQWIESHKGLTWWLGIGSVAMFAGSLFVIPWLIARIPPLYFMDVEPPPDSFRAEYPALRILLLILKNLLGLVLIILGLAMLVLPGQGVLAILVGILLLNFPGKRKLEIWLIKLPAINQSINWIRRKAHQPPLVLPGQRRLG